MDELIQVDKAALREAWTETVTNFADWSVFISMTFDTADRTHDVTWDESLYLWRRLVQALNRQLYGNHYLRQVGHSYFPYALAFEYQTRGVLHMHALAEGPTNWEAINGLWRQMAGIVNVEPVTNKYKSAKYLCKYVTKGGDVILYRSNKKIKPPAFKPAWYLNAICKLEAWHAESKTSPCGNLPTH